VCGVGVVGVWWVVCVCGVVFVCGVVCDVCGVCGVVCVGVCIVCVMLHADRYTFLIISRLFLLKMRNVLDKSCTENGNTHFVFSDFFSKILLFMR